MKHVAPAPIARSATGSGLPRTHDENRHSGERGDPADPLDHDERVAAGKAVVENDGVRLLLPRDGERAWYPSAA